MTSFLTFCYFFFNYIEEKAAEYKLQQEAEAKKLDKDEWQAIIFQQFSNNLEGQDFQRDNYH